MKKLKEDIDYSLKKRDFLIDKYQNESMNLSKLIITLSTGAIVFSASLIRNAERVSGSSYIVILLLCWASFGISILLGVLFLHEVLKEMRGESEKQDQFFMHPDEGATSRAVELYNEILPAIRKSEKKFSMWQFRTFLLGLVFLVIYSVMTLFS